MAIQIGSTTVIDDSRNLSNITNQQTFVGAGTAGLGVGSVGTYALLRKAVGGTANSPGYTSAGSDLHYTSVIGIVGNTPSGTWRLMGQISNGTDPSTNTSVWLRIS